MVLKNNPMLSEAECHTLIKGYLNSNEFKVLDYEESDVEELENYFKIKITTLNGIQPQMTFIGKRFENPEKGIIGKEIFSYECIYGDCEFTPKYYYGNRNKFIIMDDFIKKGFTQPKSMDVDHLKLTLRNLAKMHTIGVEFGKNVFRDKLKTSHELIDGYEDLIHSKFLQSGWFEDSFKNLSGLMDMIPERHLDANQIITEITAIFQKFKDIDPDGLFKTFCHGGLWNRNILFKYDSNMKPLECIFVNFEFQHYGSPIIDVLQFVYMNTNQEIRKIYLHDLLEFYYKCLQSELELKGLNKETVVLKKEDYETSIHYFLPLIKLEMACLKQFPYLNNKQNKNRIHENDSFKKLLEEFRTNATFRKSLTESLMELQNLVVQPRLTLEDCFKIIKNKIGTTNYELIGYKIIPLGKISGYMGDHNKLKIEIIVNKNRQTLHLFAKFMPRGKTAVVIENDTDAFHKEIFFFQQFVPLLRNFQIDTINECVVPCYFTRHKDVLVFEDITVQNYMCFEPRKPIDFECVRIVINKMARFHTANIILEEKISEQRNTKYSLMQDFANEFQESLITPNENHQGGQVIKTGIEAIDYMMELFPNTNKNISLSEEEIKIKIKKAFDASYEIVKPSKEFRNVFCHGDLWITNILIQCMDGKPIDCRFIDFQMTRYCPPAQDLVSFIFLTTTRNFRKQHFSNLIEIYYEELSKNIKLYGYDIDNIYPYESFMKSVEYVLPQAVCQTTCWFQTTLLNSDILEQFMSDEESARNVLVGNRKDFITAMYQRDPLFRERAAECIQDLRETCIKYF